MERHDRQAVAAARLRREGRTVVMAETIDDEIVRCLARSGIRLGDGDLLQLRAACVTLGAARDAVTAEAQRIRSRDERRWRLPPGSR